MNSLYSELQWLPRAPREFRERLKSLGKSEGDLGRELQSLASHALDVNQLTSLAKAIGKARVEGKSLDPLVPFRLAVLSNSTIDLIVPALVASAARHGMALEVIQPSYDQVAQEAFTPDSKVNRSKPDAVLLALDYRALAVETLSGGRGGIFRHRARRPGYLQALRDGIKFEFECRLHFSNLRSARGNALRKPGPGAAGNAEKPHRPHQPRTG